MRYIEAPEIYDGTGTAVFLAGGITDCPNWQQEIVTMLKDTGLTLLNPRRTNFPIHDPGAALAQITWEHKHLRTAAAISFWFPMETLCPIVLYELGAWSMTDKPIFVGRHPKYQRVQDVDIQTGLARPDIVVVAALSDLARQVRQWQVTR
jgi:hypothetical protein